MPFVKTPIGIKILQKIRHSSYKWSFLTLLFMLVCGSAFSMNPPKPLCTEVQTNGDVLLTWKAPNDPGGIFYSYLVFVEDLAGNPVQIDEIFDITTTSFNHVGADAQNFSRTYFLRTLAGTSGQVSSPDSSPIQTMLLSVSAGGLNARANLQWNAPYENLPVSATGFYDISIEPTSGNWQPAGGTLFGDETYLDTIQGICNDPPALINYRVEMTDNSGCVNLSSFDGDLLTDGTGPTPPVIETVTVDTLTGNLIICWYPSPEDDTAGYVIQDNTNETTYINIGNTQDPDITCFEHTITPSGSKRYLVIAYDECGNDESFGTGHESMYLQATLQECDQKVNLSWTPYVGWSEGVEAYEVYASQDGSPFQLMETNAPTNRQYTADVAPFSDYCFRVAAVSAGDQRSSYTNRACLQITYPQTPQFVYLNRVDVLPDDQGIEINLLPDNDAAEMKYHLERRAPSEIDFEEIGVMQENLSTGLYTFTDTEVNPKEDGYRYRVAAFDFCENFFSYSNVSGNILLGAYSNNDDYISEMQWNNYESWNGGVSQYRIYRALGKNNAYSPLANVNGNVGFYEDDVYDLIETHGEFCYYIEAIENYNSFGRSDTVRSNIACAVQDPLLWVPNAFMVGGYNDVFKPVAGYLDFERYEMQIYSRWGREVFRSNSIDLGWNGDVKGSTAPEGIYIYVISFKAGNGKTIEQKGSVLLLNAKN